MKELNIGGLNHDNEETAISPHHEEMNMLKIDKLSNRVTIISIIIPCIIGAILVFGYFDMQETVIDVNLEKQSKILEITEQFGEKTNALEVKLANTQVLLEKKLPEIEKKIAKLEASIAKLASTKVDKTSLKKNIATINANRKNNKKLIDTLSKTSQNNQALVKASQTKFNKDLSTIKNKLDTKLDQIEDYENAVATTMKNLSILQKRYDEFKKDSITKQMFDKDLNEMNQSLNRKLEQLDKKLSTSLNNIKQIPLQKNTSSKKESSQEKTKDKASTDEKIFEESIEE